MKKSFSHHPILRRLKTMKHSLSRSLCKTTAWFYSRCLLNSQLNQGQRLLWRFRHNLRLLVASLTKTRLQTTSCARPSPRQEKSQLWLLLALQRVTTTSGTSISKCSWLNLISRRFRGEEVVGVTAQSPDLIWFALLCFALLYFDTYNFIKNFKKLSS